MGTGPTGATSSALRHHHHEVRAILADRVDARVADPQQAGQVSVTGKVGHHDLLVLADAVRGQRRDGLRDGLGVVDRNDGEAGRAAGTPRHRTAQVRDDSRDVKVSLGRLPRQVDRQRRARNGPTLSLTGAPIAAATSSRRRSRRDSSAEMMTIAIPITRPPKRPPTT